MQPPPQESEAQPDKGATGSFSAPEESRRFLAKRTNEHVKAIYSLTNTLGAAIIATAYILPEIQGVKVVQELDRPGWVLIGLLVVAVGHAAIRWCTRRED